MTANVYDVVRYSNNPYGQTHPNRLATVAILYGMRPPDPQTARVLEVGCGAGGNLMAMAAATPGIRALGIDLAAGPIADGRAAAAEIGLDNLDLRVADIRDVADGRLGEFDYVVAHGIYSWVPADVRDALLETVRASLAPDGVAYVSYNAYPGGYFRRMLRDVGLWHARHEPDALAVAAKAQELYKYLEQERAGDADHYGALLARELPPFAEGPLWRLVHDDLADDWYPVWFGEFAEHAAAHQLGYVGEADLYGVRNEVLPAGVPEQLRAFADGDRVAYETFSDVLVARHFRQSVLCHAGVAVREEPRAGHAALLQWSSRVNAEPLEVGLLHDAYAELERVRPRSLGFEELRANLNADPGALAEALLDGFRRERLVPHALPLRAAAEPGERPRASALARWQAAHGPEMTTLAYTTVRMEEPAARLLVTLLDGTRDRAAIRAELHSRAQLELSEADLEANLVELTRLFLLEPEG